MESVRRIFWRVSLVNDLHWSSQQPTSFLKKKGCEIFFYALIYGYYADAVQKKSSTFYDPSFPAPTHLKAPPQSIHPINLYHRLKTNRLITLDTKTTSRQFNSSSGQPLRKDLLHGEDLGNYFGKPADKIFIDGFSPYRNKLRKLLIKEFVRGWRWSWGCTGGWKGRGAKGGSF